MEPRRQFDRGVDGRSHDAGLKRAEPGRPGLGVVRSLAVRAAAGFLAAFAAFVALPAAVQAQIELDAKTSVVVGESSQAFLDIALKSEPTGDVTVNVVSNDTGVFTVTPASFTFTPLNWSEEQGPDIIPVHDANTTDDTGTLTLSGTGVTTVTVTVLVVDDDLPLTLPSSPVALIEDGGMASFEVALGSAPGRDRRVTVESDDTGAVQNLTLRLDFTTVNWATPQTVNLTAVADSDQRDEQVTITLHGSNVATGTVTVNVTDDDEPVALTLTPSAVGVTEGSTETFTVELASVPVRAVTVTVASGDPGAATVQPASLVFGTGDWNVPQPVTVTGVADGDQNHERVTITLSGSRVTTGTATVDVTDDDKPVALTLKPSAVSVTEGSTRPFTVELASVPVRAVTVTVASGDPGAATVHPTSLVFGTGNWNVPQPVTVTGANDSDTADERVTITLSGSRVTTGTVTANVTDDDKPVALTLTPSAVSVTEGSTGPFTVELASVPVRAVTVTVASGDPGAATVQPASLDFGTGDWNVPQPVTVTGVDDSDTADEQVTITLSGSRVTTGTVTANVTDDDKPVALTLTPSAVSVTEGSTGPFTVELASVPVRAVTVTVASGDPGAATVQPASLDFGTGDWNVPQPVTVTGVDDSDAADERVTITLSGSRVTTGTVTANVTDDDKQVALTLKPSAVSVTEGSTQPFTVELASVPVRAVTVTVASGDPGAATVQPASLDFGTGDWNVPQPVTVTGVDDSDTADEQVTITLSGARVTTGTVTANVTDDDKPVALTLTPSAVSVTEGSTGPFTVELASVPVRAVTVTVASGDPGAATVQPASLVFGTGDWNVPQPVTVTGVDDSDTADEQVTITLSGSRVTTGTVTVDVTDNDSPPPSGPPEASFTHDAECAEGLCRALTDRPVAFQDTSSGEVEVRTWEFGDGEISEQSTLGYAWPEPGFYEVTLTVSGADVDSVATQVFLVEASEPAGTCEPTVERRCLLDSRYAVEVDWFTEDGESGAGKVVPAGTNGSGLFLFFGEENWELLIKVLDGCATNGHVWVFGAATTDLAYEIRVTDTDSGAVKEYRNEPGKPAPAITDAAAFPEGCRP